MWDKTSLKHIVNDCHGNPIQVRSKLEIDVVKVLNAIGIPWKYESEKLSYIIPESTHSYTPDFTVNNTIYLEGKGLLADHQERTKYILLKEQIPNLDLRFIFGNPNKRCAGMKQTHAEWATKHGFLYCGIKDMEIIKQWVQEFAAPVK